MVLVKIENNIFSTIEQKRIMIYDTYYDVRNVMKWTGYTDFYAIKNNYNIFL